MNGGFLLIFRKPNAPDGTTPAQAALAAMPTEHLQTLHRIAKHHEKGLRPFFADPRSMIALRDELSRRNATGEADA